MHRSGRSRTARRVRLPWALGHMREVPGQRRRGTTAKARSSSMPQCYQAGTGSHRRVVVVVVGLEQEARGKVQTGEP